MRFRRFARRFDRRRVEIEKGVEIVEGEVVGRGDAARGAGRRKNCALLCTFARRRDAACWVCRRKVKGLCGRGFDQKIDRGFVAVFFLPGKETRPDRSGGTLSVELIRDREPLSLL